MGSLFLPGQGIGGPKGPPVRETRCRFCLQDAKVKSDAIFCHLLEALFLNSQVVIIGLALLAVEIDIICLCGIYTN